MQLGAGAEMRQAIGIAVFSGMIGVTIFGLILTPVFYVIMRKIEIAFSSKPSKRISGRKVKMRILSVFVSILVITGCYATQGDLKEPDQPYSWSKENSAQATIVDANALKEWWLHFEDPTLNQLVQLSLIGSPDRRIAEAKINEARGIKRTNRSALFPQIDATARNGREDTGNDTDDFYEAGFDASFELDVFGQNRKRVDAASAQLSASEEQYFDVTLTLVSEVARAYTEYREFQKQVKIAKKNLDIQVNTLKLIRDQESVGESPQLDVERAENLVNTTKASIPEFERSAENAKLRLSVLTGELPIILSTHLDENADIPGAGIKPVLLTPAQVLFLRPDVRAAAANLSASTALAEAETADIFPTFELGGFFGVADSAIISSATVWNIFIGGAVALLDFGRIEGRVDSARAREVQSYEIYRRTILEAVTEVEIALNDYAKINEQRISLHKAYDNADKALEFSRQLFTEGEVSFLDVLDSQRTVNEADSALVTAQAAQTESLIRLYKSLGVY